MLGPRKSLRKAAHAPAAALHSWLSLPRARNRGPTKASTCGLNDCASAHGLLQAQARGLPALAGELRQRMAQENVEDGRGVTFKEVRVRPHLQ